IAALQLVIFGVGDLRRVLLVVGNIRVADQLVEAIDLGPRLGLRIALDLAIPFRHVTSDNSLPAAARASSVIRAPASIRAISSRRASPSSGRTCVRTKAPLATSCFSINRCVSARAATCGAWVTVST